MERLYWAALSRPASRRELELGARVAMVERGLLPDVGPEEITYFVGRQTVIPTKERPGMALWREVLFATLNRNAELSADYFCIPAAQTIEVGISIEI